jgi:hypothetical protein
MAKAEASVEEQLVDITVKTHMRMFGLDRETAARYWVRSAAETAD